MLTQDIQTAIEAQTVKFWGAIVSTDEFVKLASGKEIGHRIADYVDEETTTLIEANFTTRRQRNARGVIMARSMGDIWVFSNGIYNPVNVKAGEIGKNGQPNMVSLKKLLRALLLRQIDAYYLLIVKMNVLSRSVFVYLVDILDYLDYMAFDSGPGQIMLKERQFYEAINTDTKSAPLTIDEKIERLFQLLEDADRRLRENRERVAATIREMRQLYAVSKNQPIDQSGLNLL